MEAQGLVRSDGDSVMPARAGDPVPGSLLLAEGEDALLRPLAEAAVKYPATQTGPELAEWESAYLLRLQSDQLQQLLDTLARPLDARAREMKARGMEAYAFGWFDDARADLTEAATLNRYDFSIHQALGNIAFAHLGELDDAARHYADAARYAAPKSGLDAAYAHVSLAAISESRGDMLAALCHARDALDVCETCASAHYGVAKYLAATGGDRAEIADHLAAAFRRNVRFCLHAETDHVLAPSRDVVAETIARHRELLAQAATRKIASLTEAASLIERGVRLEEEAGLAERLQATRAIRDRLAGAVDSAPLIELADILLQARREGAEHLAAASTTLRECSDRIERGDAEALESARLAARAIAERWHYYAFGGALAGAGLVFLSLPLVLGREAVMLGWLMFAPVLMITGFVAGVVLNRTRVSAARRGASPRTDLGGSCVSIAERLESLGGQLAAGVRQLGDGAQGAPAEGELAPA